jgi:branched-chain amino acid transport system substrate-binding protein
MNRACGTPLSGFLTKPKLKREGSIMRRFRFVVTVLLAACLVLTVGFPAWAAETIKIGVIGPMKFVQGKGHWNGATMAAEEINARGGLWVGKKKMKVELVKADSNEFLSMTDATNAMELLVARHKVDFLVGGFRTEAVLAMQDIAMDYKKIFIGCGAAHPELCTRVAKDYKRYKYWFRGTPFNSRYLVKTCFIHMATVGAILKGALNIPKIKVAIVAEKAVWVDPMIAAAKGFIPKMGMEVAGIWRPSAVATDVTAELSAIQRSGAHLIFTTFSSSVGIPFARQAGELKIPAAQVGINVEAQKDGLWEATQGMGNYVMTMNTYARGVETNDLTAPFVNRYIERFGETPTYTADTYQVIIYNLAPVIEEAETLDADKLVAIIENREYVGPGGKVKYMKDAEGRHLHDLTWGPGYLTSLGVQWQDGALKGVWPNRWKASKDAPEITYKGIVPYKVAPWIIQEYKK